MPLIHDDFLLQTATARRLYHQFAADQPILDYHCHLPPQDIAENRAFGNLFDIWLEGDHYKWRAMRANGVPEQLLTGTADPRAKFEAWARTVPYTLRNPLYHWTHLELKRYFDIDQLLDERSAAAVWDQAAEQLATDQLRVHGILKKFRVAALCTTDDPADDLAWHRAIAQSPLETRVFPAFRPDNALLGDQPDRFNQWVDRLAAASDIDIRRLSDFLDAIGRRHAAFHEAGCRISDHGLGRCFADPCPDQTAVALFDQVRGGTPLDPEAHRQFNAYLMLHFGRLDAERGWTKQLHLGVRRNNNSRMFQQAGPDTGFDSIADWHQAEPLCRYLDQLARQNALPKTIVYNLNPADNYLIATLLGSFQDSSIPGKMQFGTGWWYLDQKEAIEWQLNTLSNVGLLSRFIGMLTDSRSFMSFPRHEYFRRVLCNLVGGDAERGELPDCDELLGPLVRNICYQNARDYLGLEIDPAAASG